MSKTYTDLLVWQEAMCLAELVYSASKSFPREELYGLVSQIRRAAVSVPSNIAEGQARKTRGEFVHFLGMARGSLAEIGTQTKLARRLDMLPNNDARALEDQITKVAQLLNGLIASLPTTHKQRTTKNEQRTT